MDPHSFSFAAIAATTRGLDWRYVLQAIVVALATAILTAYTTVKVVEVQLMDVTRRVNIMEERMLLQSDRISRMEGENSVRHNVKPK